MAVGPGYLVPARTHRKRRFQLLFYCCVHVSSGDYVIAIDRLPNNEGA
jgi:hypothetical protein